MKKLICLLGLVLFMVTVPGCTIYVQHIYHPDPHVVMVYPRPQPHHSIPSHHIHHHHHHHGHGKSHRR